MYIYVYSSKETTRGVTFRYYDDDDAAVAAASGISIRRGSCRPLAKLVFCSLRERERDKLKALFSLSTITIFFLFFFMDKTRKLTHMGIKRYLYTRHTQCVPAITLSNQELDKVRAGDGR